MVAAVPAMNAVLLILCFLSSSVATRVGHTFPRSAARLAVRPRIHPQPDENLSQTIVELKAKVISCASDINLETAAYAQVWVRNTVAGTYDERCAQSMGLIEDCLVDDRKLLALESAMKELRIALGQWPSCSH